jgi:hypothetical protein
MPHRPPVRARDEKTARRYIRAGPFPGIGEPRLAPVLVAGGACSSLNLSPAGDPRPIRGFEGISVRRKVRRRLTLCRFRPLIWRGKGDTNLELFLKTIFHVFIFR